VYADDTQLYKNISQFALSSIIQDMKMCCQSVKSWMLSNKLKLNDGKTEIVFISTESKIRNIQIQSMTITDSVVTVSDSAKNVGVFVD